MKKFSWWVMITLTPFFIVQGATNSLVTTDSPDVPSALPEFSQSPLENKIFWQNRALNLLHGEEINTSESENYQSSKTLVDQLDYALLNAKIEEWFF